MKGINLGSKNGMWKGNKVSYSKLHAWVRRHLLKPKFCTKCKINPPHDVANISQKYIRKLSDWEWLCRTCHMIKDGRMKKLIIRNKKNNPPLKPCKTCGIMFQPTHSRKKYHNRKCWINRSKNV